MSDLKDKSTEELQAELERRKASGEKLKPELLAAPDLSKLKLLCVSYLDAVAEDEVDDDMDRYIFEAAMEAFYGGSVWEYVNERVG